MVVNLSPVPFTAFKVTGKVWDPARQPLPLYSGIERLVEMAAKADREETVAAIRAGLADVEAGRTKPARQALRALAKKHGIVVAEREP